MRVEGSCDSPDLDSNECDKDERFGTLDGGFVVACQTSVAHQPAKGSLHHPAVSQELESPDSVRSFDDLDREFAAQRLDPTGEHVAGVTSIHPDHAQPGQPTEDAQEKRLGSISFGDIGRCDFHPQHQTEAIGQQVSFAPLDLFGGVVPHFAAVGVGFDTLTVENRGRWPCPLAIFCADQGAQLGIDRLPEVISDPAPEDVENRFRGRKVSRQQTPRAAGLGYVQQGIEGSSAELVGGFEGDGG